MTDENSQNPTLSKKQLKAIPAILSARSIAEGCKEARINRDTYYTWQKNPAFKAEYERQSRAIIDEAFQGLKGLTGEAVETLRKLLSSRQDAVKLRAAQLVIESTMKRIELEDVGNRIAALEEVVKAARAKA